MPDNCYHNRAHVASLLTAAAFNKSLLLPVLPGGDLWDTLKLALLHCTASCHSCMGADPKLGIYEDLEAAERATVVMRLADVTRGCNVCAAARAVLLCRKPVESIGDNVLAGVVHDLLLSVVGQYDLDELVRRKEAEERWIHGEKAALKTRKKLVKYCRAYVAAPLQRWCIEPMADRYALQLAVKMQEWLDHADRS